MSTQKSSLGIAGILAAASAPAFLHGLSHRIEPMTPGEFGATLDRLGMRRRSRPVRTHDGLMTFDQATVDSSGVFLVGELERLDPELHMPLAAYTWSRDIDLREDVTIGDESSSFTNSSFAAAFGVSGSGKAWVGKDASAITGISLDIGKTIQPLPLWAMQLGWTLPELASAQQLGRPVDTQKYEGMQLKYNMDVDEQVYVGDDALGMTGLCNGTSVANVANATHGNWTTAATVDDILADVNEILTSAWTEAAYAYTPSRLLLPPLKFSYLVANKVSNAGNISVLEFLKGNNVSTANRGASLEVMGLKWLPGLGAGATDRMVAYSKEKRLVRFPMVPLQRTPLEYRDLRQITTYYGRLGQVEFVYPETVAFRDGI